MSGFESLPLWKAAYCVLGRTEGLHISHLLERIEHNGWKSSGKTPLQTLRSELRRYSSKSGNQTVYFENLGQATWRLSAWGLSNPPKGTEKILSPKQPTWVDSEEAFTENQSKAIAVLNSGMASTESIQTHTVFVYDANAHHFLPMQWLLCKDSRFQEVLPDHPPVNLYKDFGLVLSEEPLMFTRFAQWCREMQYDALLEPAVRPNLQLYQIGRFRELDPVQLQEIEQALSDMYTERGDQNWTVQSDTLRRLHLSWTSSENRFVLLSGLTGIGKSNLIWDYAGAVLKQYGLSEEKHRLMVSVQTNFRDPAPLFGYVNTFANPPVFIHGLLTRFLMDAHLNPHLPYFLLLDETNLSKIEHYLAPWISTFEVGAPLVFHQGKEPVSGVPPTLPSWPRNVWVAGTMNFESGSHLPADKILDRAHSIELWDVDVTGWLENKIQNSEMALLHSALPQLYTILRPLYCHFGYRSLNAMVEYIQVGQVMGVDIHRLLDEAVLSKVLPKIKGGRGVLTTEVFSALSKWCEEFNAPLSLSKIRVLSQQVQSLGMVQYWH